MSNYQIEYADLEYVYIVQKDAYAAVVNTNPGFWTLWFSPATATNSLYDVRQVFSIGITEIEPCLCHLMYFISRGTKKLNRVQQVCSTKAPTLLFQNLCPRQGLHGCFCKEFEV